MMLQLVAEEMQTEAPAADLDDIDVENVIEGERAGGLQVCRVCHQHHPSEEFIRCTECQHSFHRLKCVTPAVYENMDDWRCGDCGGPMDMDTRLPAAADITEDQATMSYLQNGKFPEEADRKEQNRIRKRALNFEIKSWKIIQTEKPIIWGAACAFNPRTIAHRGKNAPNWTPWCGQTTNDGQSTVLLARD